MINFKNKRDIIYSLVSFFLIFSGFLFFSDIYKQCQINSVNQVFIRVYCIIIFNKMLY